MTDEHGGKSSDGDGHEEPSTPSKSIPTWRRWLRRTVRISFFAFLALALFGFIWNQVATRKFCAKYPPSGDMVRIDNVDFHVLVRGTRQPNDPVLVIEPGVGEGVSEWLDIVKECEAFTQVVVTDRRGHGYSSGVPTGSVPPRQNANYLKKILDAKGIEPPYVLAGHSMGGLIARFFESMYPDEVAGLILIDSVGPREAEEVESLPLLLYPLAYSGVFGVPQMLGIAVTDERLFPEEHSERILGNLHRGTYYISFLNHWAGVIDAIDEVNEVLGAECVVPLTVISANGVSLDDRQLWDKGQKRLQGISATAKCIDLDCHHSVFLAKPDLVVSEFRSMLDRARLHLETSRATN